MASTVIVKINSSAIAAMLKSAGVRSSLGGPSEAVLGSMRGNVPVESGTLRDSLHIWDETTDRAVKRAGSDVDYVMVVEARTGFMSRAADG